MNTKIKIEVLKTMAETSSCSSDRYEIRKRLETLQDEELVNSERRQTWILGLILFALIGILISLDLNFWKPKAPLPEKAGTSHFMDKTLSELIWFNPVSTPEGRHPR